MLNRQPGAATGYVRDQLQRAIAYLKLPPHTAPLRPVRLPSLPPSKTPLAVPAGVRLFIRLPEHPQPAYRIPIVQPIALTSAEWATLAHPSASRTVAAELLRVWLEQVFPVGMKEMVGANIHNDRVGGSLTLRPAGSDTKYRYAILSGMVALTLAGRTQVEHDGTLKVVLAYPKTGSGIVALKGILNGTYPETDSFQNRVTQHPYVVVLESL